MGLRIIAVDAGDEKGELCTKLGAEKYIDFTKATNLIEEIMGITTYGGTYFTSKGGRQPIYLEQ